jgi:hypothetical protein
MFCFIKDGKSNKIDVIDHLTTKDGVVSGKLTLSREPIFGTWTIQVDAVVTEYFHHTLCYE